LTRLELAARLGVHPITIAKWQQEGLPIASRGRRGVASRYNEADVRAWLEAREERARQNAPDFAACRARKELAQAIEAEQRVAMRAKQLIPIEEVDRIWSAQVAAVRSRLLSWPTALADRLHRVAATDGAAGVERVLQDAAYETLRELAGGTPLVKKRRSRKKLKRTTKKRRGVVA
jgi:phage terminase Nu1 subunit (DNA packaging protein)